MKFLSSATKNAFPDISVFINGSATRRFLKKRKNQNSNHSTAINRTWLTVVNFCEQTFAIGMSDKVSFIKFCLISNESRVTIFIILALFFNLWGLAEYSEHVL